MAISRHMSTTEQQSALAGQSASVAQLVDVILDKGIVIDAWARVSVLGLELLTIEARMVVASVDTYLRYAEAIALALEQGSAWRKVRRDAQRSSSRGRSRYALVREVVAARFRSVTKYMKPRMWLEASYGSNTTV